MWQELLTLPEYLISPRVFLFFVFCCFGGTVTEYLRHKCQRIFSFVICHDHNPILYLFMTHHQAYHKNNMKDGISEEGIVYPSGALEFTLGLLLGSCCSFFSFLCSVLLIIVCPFVFFLLYCLSSNYGF